MRNQEQTKNTSWYNNRFVLILFFVVVYVIVPVILKIGVDGQWCTTVSTGESGTGVSGVTTNIYLIIYILIAAAIFVAILFLMRKDFLEKEKQKLCEDFIYKNDEIKSFVRNTITKQIANKINGIEITKQTVQAAITEGIRQDIKYGIRDAMKEGIKSEIISQVTAIEIKKESIEKIVNESISSVLNNNELMKQIVSGVLNDSAYKDSVLKPIVEKAFDVQVLKNELSVVIKEKMEEVYDKEIRKQSFAGYIVEQICKNNSFKKEQIDSIKDIINSIMGD